MEKRKLKALSPHQLYLLKAAHILRTLPLDYCSVDVSNPIEIRMTRHVTQKETFRLIWSGEAAILEHNERVSIAKEISKIKNKRSNKEVG